VGNPNNLQTPDTFFELASSVEFGPYLAGPLLGRGAAVFLPDFNGPFRFSEIGLGFGYVQGHGSVVLTDPGQLVGFTASPAADELNLSFNITPLHSPQLPILGTTSLLSGRLTVTYLFDELDASQELASDATLPEPASLVVFGFAAILMCRRRTLARDFT
jgi:hypothetical protein